MSTVTESRIWRSLERLAENFAQVHLRDLVLPDETRFQRYHIQHGPLLLDYSRNLCTDQVHSLLHDLALERGVPWWRQRLLDGEPLNQTERRAAGHPFLRASGDAARVVDGEDVSAEVEDTLERMRALTRDLREGRMQGGTGRAFTDVVHVGIGGSHLGPNLAVDVLTRSGPQRVRFLSSLDPMQADDVLTDLDPETTLFIIASKSFRTEETLTNARNVLDWAAEALGEEAALGHCIAVTAYPDRAVEFGIERERVFELPLWVGGRFSLWSAVGLPVMIHAGTDAFDELLAGARCMDEHFRDAPLEDNMPVALALLGVWYRNFLGCQTHAVLPYADRLKRLTEHLQQLEMESLGKRIDRDGAVVDYDTAGVIWGGSGNEGQHAFFQLLHQGTLTVPMDLIVCADAGAGRSVQQTALQAQVLAQGAALMLGKDEDAVIAELSASGLSREEMVELVAHKLFEGGRPSNTLVLDRLDARALGALLALYEHKVFVQSVIWNINPFDQWGVELGKQMAPGMRARLEGEGGEGDVDTSTRGLLEHLRSRRRD